MLLTFFSHMHRQSDSSSDDGGTSHGEAASGEEGVAAWGKQ
jgi:hypothetical protein